jgi:hypothetical protein
MISPSGQCLKKIMYISSTGRCAFSKTYEHICTYVDTYVVDSKV